MKERRGMKVLKHFDIGSEVTEKRAIEVYFDELNLNDVQTPENDLFNSNKVLFQISSVIFNKATEEKNGR